MDVTPTSYKSMLRKLEVLKERAEQLESAAAKPPERWWVPPARLTLARSQGRPPLQFEPRSQRASRHPSSHHPQQLATPPAQE